MRREHAMNFFAGEAPGEKAFDQSLHSRLGGACLFSTRFHTALGNYEGARTVTQLEKASAFQLGIGFNDRIGTNNKLFGEGADARKVVAITKDASFNRMADLLHHLRIKGLARGRVEFENHVRATVSQI